MHTLSGQLIIGNIQNVRSTYKLPKRNIDMIAFLWLLEVLSFMM